MPSTQPIKRNHFIKLHWLEILAYRNLHGQPEELSCQPPTSSCYSKYSPPPIAHAQLKSAGKRFRCAIFEKLLVVARSLPNTYYQPSTWNPEESREYIEQKASEGKKSTLKKARPGGPS